MGVSVGATSVVRGSTSVVRVDTDGVVGVLLARPGLPLLVSVGVVLLGVGAVILLASTGGLDRRLPTQVLPRRFALYPLVAGAAVLGAAGMLWLLP